MHLTICSVQACFVVTDNDAHQNAFGVFLIKDDLSMVRKGLCFYYGMCASKFKYGNRRRFDMYINIFFHVRNVTRMNIRARRGMAPFQSR